MRDGERQNLGPILDNLGITVDLEDGQQITDVVVIAKITDFDKGTTAVGIYHNDLDWISQLGLLQAARMVVGSGDFEPLDEDS